MKETMKKEEKRPVVAYYTSTNFLDACLETIQSIQQVAQVHVFIEIGQESMKSNIVEVDTIEKKSLIETPESILGTVQWNKLQPYFTAVTSVQFVVFQSKRSLSFRTIVQSFQLGKYLKKINPSIIHFDTISLRSIGLYPFLRGKNILIALHDAVPHAGEYSWKEEIPGWLYYRNAKGYIFYSNYSKNVFKKAYTYLRAPLYNIQLQQYSIIKPLYAKKDILSCILFFGRLSYYKGIDILLDAIPMVLEKYPNERFVIAGKRVFQFKFNSKNLFKYPENIQLIDRHIAPSELANLINQAKFVVCPYREATQSGVVMTAFALQKSVIGTLVGAFPEYIAPGMNGLLAEPNAIDLADKIIEALNDCQYRIFNQNLNGNKEPEIRMKNAQIIHEAYQYCLQ